MRTNSEDPKIRDHHEYDQFGSFQRANVSRYYRQLHHRTGTRIHRRRNPCYFQSRVSSSPLERSTKRTHVDSRMENKQLTQVFFTLSSGPGLSSCCTQFGSLSPPQLSQNCLIVCNVPPAYGSNRTLLLNSFQRCLNAYDPCAWSNGSSLDAIGVTVNGFRPDLPQPSSWPYANATALKVCSKTTTGDGGARRKVSLAGGMLVALCLLQNWV